MVRIAIEGWKSQQRVGMAQAMRELGLAKAPSPGDVDHPITTGRHSEVKLALAIGSPEAGNTAALAVDVPAHRREHRQAFAVPLGPDERFRLCLPRLRRLCRRFGQAPTEHDEHQRHQEQRFHFGPHTSSALVSTGIRTV